MESTIPLAKQKAGEEHFTKNYITYRDKNAIIGSVAIRNVEMESATVF